MPNCTCTHPAEAHAVEVLTVVEPHEFGGYRSRLLTYKHRRGACTLCGCERYDDGYVTINPPLRAPIRITHVRCHAHTEHHAEVPTNGTFEFAPRWKEIAHPEDRRD